MVTTNDLRKFIKTEGYVSLFEEMIGRLSLHVDENEPQSQLFNIHAGYVNKSGVSLDELEKPCSSDKERLIKYVRLKSIEIENDEDDYNDGEDNSVTLEILPYPKSFLIGHLVEFYFLKNKPSDLVSYFKKARVVNPVKYGKDLKSI